MGFTADITSFCPYLPVLRGMYGLWKHSTISAISRRVLQPVKLPVPVCTIKTQPRIPLLQQPSPFKKPVPLLQTLLAPMLGNHHRAVGKQPKSAPAQQPQRSRILFARIPRRIEKYHIVAFSPRIRCSSPPKKRPHRDSMNPKSRSKPEPLQISPQNLQSRWCPLHKLHPRRAPAQSLNAHSARPRIQIQKPRPFNSRRKHVEERLPQPVAGWPRRHPRRSRKRPRTEASCNDAHKNSEYGKPRPLQSHDLLKRSRNLYNQSVCEAGQFR